MSIADRLPLSSNGHRPETPQLADALVAEVHSIVGEAISRHHAADEADGRPRLSPTSSGASPGDRWPVGERRSRRTRNRP